MMLIGQMSGGCFLRPNADLFGQILHNIFKLPLATRRNVKQNNTLLRVDGTNSGDAVIRFKDKFYESDFSAVYPVIQLFCLQRLPNLSCRTVV